VQLTATTRDADQKVLTEHVVTWASGNTALATVSSAGLVTGVGDDDHGDERGEERDGYRERDRGARASVIVAASDRAFGRQTAQLTATLKDATGNVLRRPGRDVDVE